jgi:hypothetical protein
MLVGSGILMLGALWIAGQAMTLMPSLALSSNPVSSAATMSAEPALPAPRIQVAQNVPAAPAAPTTPTETLGATTTGNSTGALPAGAEAMAEDSDGTPLPQRRFLIEARTDAIFGAEPDQPLTSAQETESATNAQAAAPERPPVTRTAPPPRRHVTPTRAGPRARHVSRRPPSLGRVLRQVNPLRVLRVGGLRVF